MLLPVSCCQVYDYVRSYLGESKAATDFAQQFLAKRSKYKKKQEEEKQPEVGGVGWGGVGWGGVGWGGVGWGGTGLVKRGWVWTRRGGARRGARCDRQDGNFTTN